MIQRRFFLLAALLSAFSAPSAAHTSDPGWAADPQQEAVALRASQAAVGRLLGDYAFVDSAGAPVRLSGFRGKPLLISLVYSSCFHTCPTTTRQLAQAVAAARAALGPDSFAVLTIGFDTRNDTPQAMADFARRQGVTAARWTFASSDAATMQRLTADLGFVYQASPKGFDHLIQVSVIDAEGRVYRQVYGEWFPVPALVEPLKQLVYGTRATDTAWTGLVKKVRLFCTTYDPASDSYRFDYSLVVGMIVGLTVLGGGVTFVVRSRHRGRR